MEQVSQVEIDLIKFRIEREDSRQVYRWDRVYDIRNTHAAIYVMTDSSSGVIIPARTFENRDEQDRFYTTVHGYWRASVQAALKARKPVHE